MDDFSRNVRDTFSIIPKSDEITRNVFHTNLAAMVITSFRSGRIIDANDVFFETFGLHRATAIGMTAVDVKIITEFDRQELVRLIRSGGTVRGVERKIQRADGSWVFMSWTAELVDIEGKECLYSVFLDITKLKIAEHQLYESKHKLEMANEELEKAMESKNRWAIKAEEANDAKSAFLANTSHEIRTPMNAIVGYTEMLLDDDISSEQRHALKMIEYSAENLLALIDNILDLSKIDANKLILEEVPFNIEELLFQTMHLVRIKASNDSVEILGDTSGITTDVKGDPLRMRQVLTNLLSNAAKFTSEGQILVHAREIRRAGSKVNIEFTVQDTGVGIDEEMADKIFEPFVQVDGSITRQYGGTGLGLAICRSLVSLMDGTISVRSAPGEGATFTFDVWLEEHKKSGSDTLVKAAYLEPFRGRKGLLVDDNGVALSILNSLLKPTCMTLVQATNLDDAIKIVSTEYVDLVWVDAEIDSTGESSIPDALRKNSINNSILVIGLSQLCTPTKQQKSGYNSYLTKPLDRTRLYGAMQKLLGITTHRKTPFPRHTVSATPFNRLKILVAEDHEVNQQLMISMVEKMGHMVNIAADGLEAIEMGRTGVYDMILMDMQMPKLSGLEATKQLRDAGVTIPIVALTASAMKVDMELCLFHGMNDYITKPIKRDKLQKVIHKHLGIGDADEVRSKVRTIMISSDEQSSEIVRSCISQMLPSSSFRRLGSLVEGLITIGSLQPHLIIVDLTTNDLDVLALVEYLQSEECYANISIIALVEDRQTLTVVSELYKVPNVEILAKPIDKMDLSDTINQIVTGNVPCSSYIPSPHMPTPAFGLPQMESPDRPAELEEDETISVEKIAKEMMLDMDEYKFLLEMYVTTNRKIIENMESGFATLAFDALAKDVHALRGSSGNLFLKKMANHCSRLEELVLRHELEPAVKEFHKVKDIFEIITTIKNGL